MQKLQGKYFSKIYLNFPLKIGENKLRLTMCHTLDYYENLSCRLVEISD